MTLRWLQVTWRRWLLAHAFASLFGFALCAALDSFWMERAVHCWVGR